MEIERVISGTLDNTPLFVQRGAGVLRFARKPDRVPHLCHTLGGPVQTTLFPH